MPFKDGPLKLSLSKDMREGVEQELCRRVRQAVADSSERNALLGVWRDQLEGLGTSATNQNWQGACDLNDPITLIAFLDTVSQLMQSMRAATPIAVESFSPEYREDAGLIEDFCAVEASRQSLWSVFYDAAHNVARDVAVPIYCGWKWEERQERGVEYRIPGTQTTVEEEDKQEGQDYDEVPVVKTKVEQGYDIQVLNMVDFYAYPANAPCLDKASIVGHRFLATEDDLIDGIANCGYDKEKVFDLIDHSPPMETEEWKAEQDSSDGVGPAPGRHGYYELFMIFTRMPRRVGDEETPVYLRHDDFICVLCPEQNIVLKLDFSPFPDRPYFLGYILPKPGSLQGYCVPSLLEPLQAEANAQIRFNIDSMNLIMAPAMKVKESEAARLNKYKIFPGAAIPVKNPDDFMPVEWDRTTLSDGMAWQRYFEEKGQAIISAPGQGTLQPKVRKAAEVQDVQAHAGTKFGLYLMMFQWTVVAQLFERMVSLKATFGNVADEGEDFVGFEGTAQKLTAQALRGKYQFVPAVTSLTMSPEVRTQTNQQMGVIVAGYWQAVLTLPPQSHPYLWHLARKQLHDLGEHTPETFIGEEPQAEPEVAPTATVAPQLQIQGGLPNAAYAGNGNYG